MLETRIKSHHRHWIPSCILQNVIQLKSASYDSLTNYPHPFLQGAFPWHSIIRMPESANMATVYRFMPWTVDNNIKSIIAKKSIAPNSLW